MCAGVLLSECWSAFAREMFGGHVFMRVSECLCVKK
jgi:hypothetical protein